ncbi:hypothetical protein JTE90_022297 [Oedothorax gibbosus]|uniref:Uncharacterized protein n=1 Tax=Oedothorax gibbosus TaxID=931172 RepID=A0AAV6VY79_9ARAC|nr:hypothetical protein JTE90_022297 [Oedothorax gibbosus]
MLWRNKVLYFPLSACHPLDLEINKPRPQPTIDVQQSGSCAEITPPSPPEYQDTIFYNKYPTPLQTYPPEVKNGPQKLMVNRKTDPSVYYKGKGMSN